ncbi:MerR family transcriptional regulator [Actinoallomurus sp. NPDC050550]|uniref:MerR family transcriptional regulator n=1 Tax=Actinoallomurus sp. NPDC050550 TaxID=3154937 RepID=UPI0033F239C3
MIAPTVMRIGDAAAALGIETHVLRHWEAVGLLTPPRSHAGHRTYDQQTLDQARMIQTLQRAGLSLRQIRQLATSAHDDRITLINNKRAEIRDRIALLRVTDHFLEHVTACRHPVIAECPECSSFAAPGR